VKLFGAQRRRETAKPLQFLELMKATFDCDGNKKQRSAGVRRHEGNSLDPRMDDFLKLMMQSSLFFKIFWEFWHIVVLRCNASTIRRINFMAHPSLALKQL
jgi:hypothetical protein